ncbi:DUF202 domain-containing protein [Tumebacillus sp. DT12]|uniref:DUF202 domain-containing protein n=1 Tax=Tumebacillus lacus TaxID=2995335 RepID=A0ABT3X0T3_9BACL|nr:DUF202 domain-containing protein [Tumebacillus lacus]MCX7569377.1 DUF202 domain-containing protein [Tumebacillus lacus]
MEREKTVDSKYIQQHLANERTFLAWIRTSITIIGLGFLAAGVVFRSTPYSDTGHWIASVVGIGAVLLGSLISFTACRNYTQKKAGINDETFEASTNIIFFTVCCLVFINLFLIVLVVLLLLE